MIYIRKQLSVKIFLSFLTVMIVGGAVLLIAAFYIAPGSYERHMEMTGAAGYKDGTLLPGMMSSPKFQGRGTGLMYGQGQGLGFMNFRAGLMEALGYAFFAAIIVAIGLSLLLSRQIVLPLKKLMNASQIIADGKYDERVIVTGSDELSQLGDHFNKMAETLAQTENLRKQLIADVSHELRTPLTGIQGYMEGMVDGIISADYDNFKLILKETNRLSRLIDDLQELSRVESGSYLTNLNKISIFDTLSISIKKQEVQFQKKGVRLLYNPSTSVEIFVNADEDRITQVITNLLGNALAFTEKGGDVIVKTERINQEIVISVKDSGIGLSEYNMHHVFDRFYRVDKSRTRINGGGSGIGLTIAKAIIEAHNGKIWVESSGEGKGATFLFSLPICGES